MMINEERCVRAFCSLQGLAIGDAFGQRFATRDPEELPEWVLARRIPRGVWRYSDDTMMAASIVEVLRRHDGIEQDTLAGSFVAHYAPERGYGQAMHQLFTDIREGLTSWRTAVPALFNGQGSYGNGAVMRVAPLGAYFADDLDLVVKHAALSATVTHTHPEAVAGATAVAVAAALACRARQARHRPTRADFIDAILPYLPKSDIRRKVLRARDLPPGTSVHQTVAALGNGGWATAQDTVPMVLFCAGESLAHFETALWKTLIGQGDLDTNCAIVGGIVACYTTESGIPPAWLNRCEPLPAWVMAEAELAESYI